MKHIEAEKLKKEIERLKQPFKKDIEDGVYPTYLCALLDFEELIDSLQQEQQEVDLEEEIDKTVCECTDGYNFDWDKFARHFIELGKNERKEEIK